MGIFSNLKESLQGVQFSLMPKSVESLDHRRETLLDEIYLAEKKMLRREISEKMFVEFREEKLKDLIAVEAEISTKKIESEINRIAAGEMDKLSPERRQAMKELIKKKELILKELKIARKKYFHREFDARTYQELIKDKNKELIEIEVQIKHLYRAEAREIMKKAEQILAMSEEQRLSSHAEEIADALFQQIPIEGESVSKGHAEYVPRRKRRKH
ncbi:MAG: hypothetical protein ABID38_05065 [Candidatus Diapherotrites archaeon]